MIPRCFYASIVAMWHEAAEKLPRLSMVFIHALRGEVACLYFEVWPSSTDVPSYQPEAEWLVSQPESVHCVHVQ
jgi:hypothetical protein